MTPTKQSEIELYEIIDILSNLSEPIHTDLVLEAAQKIQALIDTACVEAVQKAKQEFRDKFMIDPTKKYNVTGTEKAVIIELATNQEKSKP